MSNYKIETKCIQSGYEPGNGEPRILPISHTVLSSPEEKLSASPAFLPYQKHNAFF